MADVFRTFRATGNILRHLLRIRTLVTSPAACARLFMDRTPADHAARLRFRSQRFVARKEDMPVVEEVLVRGCYDAMAPYLRGLDHAPVVLDLGANVGSFALRVFAERPDAEIVSVEAAGDTFAILDQNRRLSGHGWTTLHAAAWSRDGQLSLSRNACSWVHSVQEATDATAEAVPAKTLEALARSCGREHIDLLKMDIEGAEAEVVPASMRKVDAAFMIVEIHKTGVDPRPVCSILADIFPHAWVDEKARHQVDDPNVVYYLGKQDHDLPGLVPVRLMDHLASVYDPGRLKTTDGGVCS